MRELERRIAEWRTSMRSARHVEPETLDELENHLREIVDSLVRSGQTEQEAFQIALNQLGPLSGIDSEFGKLDRVAWVPAKVSAVFWIIAAVAEAVFLANALKGRELRFLLATHVFTLTLGYVTVLLNGLLGMIYVCQRCIRGFSSRQLRSAKRASFAFNNLAAGLTAIGMGLGSLWTKAVWGRFWGWELKEIGALCVLAWAVCLTVVHWRGRIRVENVLRLSILGNIVVSLAWLGPFLTAGLRSSWISCFWMTLAAVAAVSLIFLLLGLAPAGWLRWSKT